jgi:hypothetical protein
MMSTNSSPSTPTIAPAVGTPSTDDLDPLREDAHTRLTACITAARRHRWPMDDTDVAPWLSAGDGLAYREWVRVWRERYQEIVTDIRDVKRERRAAPSGSLEQAGAQAERLTLRRVARTLLHARALGKQRRPMVSSAS